MLKCAFHQTEISGIGECNERLVEEDTVRKFDFFAESDVGTLLYLLHHAEATLIDRIVNRDGLPVSDNERQQPSILHWRIEGAGSYIGN